MKTTIKHITLAIICFTVFGLQAQDLKYTQGFYANPLKLNPAYMGMNNDLKFTLNYRSQWANIANGYTTSTFNVLYPLFVKENDRKIDLGLSVVNDKFGAFNNLDFGLALGYRLKTSNSGFISFSVMADYYQKTLDAQSLTFDDQYVLGSFDAANATNAVIANNKISFFDISGGLMWYLNEPSSKLNGYFGISGYHLNNINETFITNGSGQLPTLLSVQTGVKIKGEDSKLDITPNMRYYNQANNQVLAIGSYFDYHINDDALIKLGLWYRTNDAMAAMVGFGFSKFWLSYSYDITNSNMSTYVGTLNANEITLSFKINQADKKGVDSAPSIY